MAIIVSGASGDLGTRVTRLLLDKVPASELILLSRSPEKLDWAVQLGAQARAASFDDTGSLMTQNARRW